MQAKTEKERFLRDSSSMEMSVGELRNLSHKLQEEKEDCERELYILQKKSMKLEKELEKLGRENNEMEREINANRARHLQHDSLIQELKRKEQAMKQQLDEALKHREELNRVKIIVVELQKRLDASLKVKNSFFILQKVFFITIYLIYI